MLAERQPRTRPPTGASSIASKTYASRSLQTSKIRLSLRAPQQPPIRSTARQAPPNHVQPPAYNAPLRRSLVVKRVVPPLTKPHTATRLRHRQTPGLTQPRPAVWDITRDTVRLSPVTAPCAIHAAFEGLPRLYPGNQEMPRSARKSYL